MSSASLSTISQRYSQRIQDTQIDIAIMKHKALVYKVAAYALLAFYPLVGLALAKLVTYTPLITYIPFHPPTLVFCIFTFALLNCTQKWFWNFSDISNHYIQKMRVRVAVSNEHQKILQLTDEKFNQTVSALGLHQTSREILTPLLANYNYWFKYCNELMAKIGLKLRIDDIGRDELGDQIVDKIKQSPPEVRREVSRIFAALSQLECYLCVMKNPDNSIKKKQLELELEEKAASIPSFLPRDKFIRKSIELINQLDCLLFGNRSFQTR